MNQPNQNGSSETTRKIEFQRKKTKKERKNSIFQFEAFFKQTHQNPRDVSIDFLEWFIGFFEAEGSFCRWFDGKTPRWQIEISQKDPKLMYKIKQQLGFGNVTTFQKNKNTYWRYQVGKAEHLKALIFLFNRNLVSQHKYQDFRPFVDSFYHYRNEKFIHIVEKHQKGVSLDNYWLSGFLEGYGGFWASQRKIKNRIKLSSGLRVKFYVTQKNELVLLNQIKNMFKMQTKIYKIHNEKDKKLYDRLETTRSQSLHLLRLYLESHPFLGQKGILLKRWIRLIDYKIKEYPLTEKSSQKLTRLISSTKHISLKS